MANHTELLLEAERRGLLPPEKVSALAEARRRGLMQEPSASAGTQPTIQQAVEPTREVPRETPIDPQIPAAVREPIATIASGAVAEPIAGLAGLVSLPFGVDKATENIEAVRKALTFVPKTEEGMKGLRKVAKVLEPLTSRLEAAEESAGEAGFKAGGPALGAAGKAAPTAALSALGLGGVRKIVEGAKVAVGKVIPKELPTELFESSAKFSTTFPKEKRKALAKTSLEYGVLPTSKGTDKLNKLIGDFDRKVNKLIDNATNAGIKISRKAIFTRLKAVRRDLGGVRIEGSGDLQQINKIAKGLDEHLKKLKKKTLTPTELQEFKQDVYRRINFDAKQLRSNVGVDKARKAIARAAKEAIENVADVKSLNAELGRLLKLKEPISRSAGRIENRNILGIDAPIKIGAGTAAGGAPGAAAGIVLSVLENPKMKARIALLLKKIQDAGDLKKVSPKIRSTLATLGLLEAGRLKPVDTESKQVVND